jgi:hypothetical protein
VAETLITLRIWRKGPRGLELLDRLGEELGREVVPDDHGIVRLKMDGRGGKGWDTLRDALDRVGSDWREWLHLESRPPR